MILEPSTIVLYVENISVSSAFYQELLGSKPTDTSPSFHGFTLSTGMTLGLKTKESAQPQVTEKSRGELAFTLNSKQKVDELFTQWQSKNFEIALAPTALPYGYVFVALDPDGNHLRVAYLNNK